MLCLKVVDHVKCQYCRGLTTKFGRCGAKQRYRCKKCKKTQLKDYTNRACEFSVTSRIALHVKEGCGIRNISRLLNISVNTVLKKIMAVARTISKPFIKMGRSYEVDEMKTYINRKANEYWIIYAIDRDSKMVVDVKVGKRNKKNIKRVIDTLLLGETKQINTDRLDIYRAVIPSALHNISRNGTNHIERRNLTLRTHLKRLNRKTIAYSKSLSMLEACLKIYFWHSQPTVVC